MAHTDKGVDQARQAHGGCEMLQTPAGERETNSQAGEAERYNSIHTLTHSYTHQKQQHIHTHTHLHTHQSRVQGGHRQACVMGSWVAAASRVETRRVGGFEGRRERACSSGNGHESEQRFVRSRPGGSAGSSSLWLSLRTQADYRVAVRGLTRRQKSSSIGVLLFIASKCIL